MNSINVQIPSEQKKYSIYFPKSFKSLQQNILEQVKNRNAVYITDENIYQKSPFFDEYTSGQKDEKKLLILPAGEENKHFQTIEKILDHCFTNSCDRSSVVVAIGGGVIGDMAGFASSIFMRGIPFIQVPTTLLAMVDSSIGGKTGVDTPQGKNLIGAFHQPEAVFCTKNFLETLPFVEIQNGLCEMIKHGIITSPEHFEDLENLAENFSDEFKEGKISEELQEKIFSYVPDSIKIKQSIVEQDEKEHGVRGFLNLGHTYGHAIELLSEFTIPHGYAVAKGIYIASIESKQRRLLQDETLIPRVEKIFKNFSIDLTNPYANLLDAMHHDKKKKNGVIRCILPVKIGEVEYGVV